MEHIKCLRRAVEIDVMFALIQIFSLTKHLGLFCQNDVYFVFWFLILQLQSLDLQYINLC